MRSEEPLTTQKLRKSLTSCRLAEQSHGKVSKYSFRFSVSVNSVSSVVDIEFCETAKEIWCNQLETSTQDKYRMSQHIQHISARLILKEVKIDAIRMFVQ